MFAYLFSLRCYGDETQIQKFWETVLSKGRKNIGFGKEKPGKITYRDAREVLFEIEDNHEIRDFPPELSAKFPDVLFVFGGIEEDEYWVHLYKRGEMVHDFFNLLHLSQNLAPYGMTDEDFLEDDFLSRLTAKVYREYLELEEAA